MANILLSKSDNGLTCKKLCYSNFKNKCVDLISILREYKCGSETLIIGDSESVVGLYIAMLSALELNCSFCFKGELNDLTIRQYDEITQCHAHIVNVRLLSLYDMEKVEIDERKNNNTTNKSYTMPGGGVYFFTSGSSGIPKIIFHDTNTLRLMVKTFTLLYPEGVHYTTTPPTSLGSVQFLMLALHLQVPYIIGGGLNEAIVQLTSNDIQPIVFTYPSLLIDYVLTANNDASMPLLREINLGGEPILESDVLAMSKIFSCHVRWAYGAAEVGPLAEGIDFQGGQAVYKAIETDDFTYLELKDRISGEVDIISMVNTYNSGYLSESELRYFGKCYRTGDFATKLSPTQFIVQDRGYKDHEDNQLIHSLNTQLNVLGKQYDALFFRIISVERESHVKLLVILFSSNPAVRDEVLASLDHCVGRDILDVKCHSNPKLLKNGKLDLQYYKTEYASLESIES